MLKSKLMVVSLVTQLDMTLSPIEKVQVVDLLMHTLSERMSPGLFDKLRQEIETTDGIVTDIWLETVAHIRSLVEQNEQFIADRREMRESLKSN